MENQRKEIREQAWKPTPVCYSGCTPSLFTRNTRSLSSCTGRSRMMTVCRPPSLGIMAKRFTFLYSSSSLL